MGSQYKASSGMDGIEGGGGGEVKAVETVSTTMEMIRMRHTEFGLRVFGLVCTLVAAVVVGVDKESKVVSFSISDSMPPLHFHVTAKYNYMSAFVYFVVINSMACSYAAVSLLVSSTATRVGRRSDNNNKNNNGMSTLVMIILDLTILSLLFSANGAAAGVGVIGKYGNTHVNWNKVCNMFEKYCNHMLASLVLSLLGTFAFLCLVVLSALKLHKKSK